MGRLSGKTAFITGGGTGIGRACALHFAQEGARVAVAGRRSDPLAQVAAEIYNAGGEAMAVRCDVTDSVEVARAIENTVKRFSRVDVVVNSAGALLWTDAVDTTEAQWQQVIDTNLKGTWLVSRAAVIEMRKTGGGSIINIASILGLISMKNRAAYTAAKTGVVGLTRAMALDHAHEKIRVNCICPSIVETDLITEMFASQPDPEAARRLRMAQIPLGRFGAPDDVAHAAVYLASEESSWMTGAALPLDGGLSAY